MGDACSVQAHDQKISSVVAGTGEKSVHIVDISRPQKLKKNASMFDLPGLNRLPLDAKYNFCRALAPKVTAVRHKITQSSFVAYQLAKDAQPCQDQQKRAQTVTGLTTLDHPNICQLVESFDDSRYTYLVYQAVEGRPILSQISRQQSFSERDAANVALQAVRALSIGYEKRIYHGAMAPKNIFLNSDGHVSITDFGLAGVLKPAPLDCATVDGAMAYLSPEVVKPWLWKKRKASKGERVRLFDGEMVISPRADIWSLGVIMYTVLSGAAPFKGKPATGELASQICHTNLVFDIRSHELSRHARDFLIAALTKDYRVRPTAAQLLDHPWLMMLKNAHTAKGALLPLEICKQLGTLHAETHFKKAMLRIIATKMTPSKIKKLTNVFDSFDTDRDGQISLTEFKEGLAKHPELSSNGEIEIIFSEIDYDQSGKISVSEFIAATLDSQDALLDRVLWDTFSALDTNENGIVSREELRNAVRSVEGRLGREHAELIASRLVDEVGTSLNFADFKELIHEEGGRQRAWEQQVVRAEAALAFRGWPACARAERACREVIASRGGSDGEAIPAGEERQQGVAPCPGKRTAKTVIVRTPSEEAALEAMSDGSTACPSSGESDRSSGHDGLDKRRNRQRHGSPQPAHLRRSAFARTAEAEE